MARQREGWRGEGRNGEDARKGEDARRGTTAGEQHDPASGSTTPHPIALPPIGVYRSGDRNRGGGKSGGGVGGHSGGSHSPATTSVDTPESTRPTAKALSRRHLLSPLAKFDGTFGDKFESPATPPAVEQVRVKGGKMELGGEVKRR